MTPTTHTHTEVPLCAPVLGMPGVVVEVVASATLVLEVLALELLKPVFEEVRPVLIARGAAFF